MGLLVTKEQQYRICSDLMYGRPYNLASIKELIDKGDDGLVTDIVAGAKYSESNLPILEYVLETKTGRVLAQALAGLCVTKEKFDKFIPQIKPKDYKFLVYSKHLSTYHDPELFIAVWNASNGNGRHIMITHFPTVDYELVEESSLNVGKNDAEKWENWVDATRKHVLGVVNPAVLKFVEEQILEQIVFTREAYAREWWASVDILDKLKTDPSRKVINSLILNPYLSDEAALYLVTTHKSPSIRIQIANRSRSYHVLGVIYHNTKSVAIREAVTNNPYFVG